MARSFRLSSALIGPLGVFPDFSTMRRLTTTALCAALGCVAASAQEGPAPAPAPTSLSASAPTSRASAAARATATGVLVANVNWASLSASQKEALAPLSKEWDQLDGARKGKWLEIAARYPTLPTEQQHRLRERMVEWTRMSPAERQRARIGYQHAGELRTPEQESKLREKWDAYLRSYFDRHAFQPMTSALFLVDLRENLVKGDKALEAKLQLDRWVYEPGLPSNVARPDPAGFETEREVRMVPVARRMKPRERNAQVLPARRRIRRADRDVVIGGRILVLELTLVGHHLPSEEERRTRFERPRADGVDLFQRGEGVDHDRRRCIFAWLLQWRRDRYRQSELSQ